MIADIKGALSLQQYNGIGLKFEVCFWDKFIVAVHWSWRKYVEVTVNLYLHLRVNTYILSAVYILWRFGNIFHMGSLLRFVSVYKSYPQATTCGEPRVSRFLSPVGVDINWFLWPWRGMYVYYTHTFHCFIPALAYTSCIYVFTYVVCVFFRWFTRRLYLKKLLSVRVWSCATFINKYRVFSLFIKV